eukprot:3483745-Heterocapsa_arctica.AAC.1
MISLDIKTVENTGVMNKVGTATKHNRSKTYYVCFGTTRESRRVGPRSTRGVPRSSSRWGMYSTP